MCSLILFGRDGLDRCTIDTPNVCLRSSAFTHEPLLSAASGDLFKILSLPPASVTFRADPLGHPAPGPCMYLVASVCPVFPWPNGMASVLKAVGFELWAFDSLRHPSNSGTYGRFALSGCRRCLSDLSSSALQPLPPPTNQRRLRQSRERSQSTLFTIIFEDVSYDKISPDNLLDYFLSFDCLRSTRWPSPLAVPSIAFETSSNIWRYFSLDSSDSLRPLALPVGMVDTHCLNESVEPATSFHSLHSFQSIASVTDMRSSLLSVVEAMPSPFPLSFRLHSLRSFVFTFLNRRMAWFRSGQSYGLLPLKSLAYKLISPITFDLMGRSQDLGFVISWPSSPATVSALPIAF